MQRKKILFLSPLPPPYYGSAISSKDCLNILEKDKTFEVVNIKINFAQKMRGIGKISLEKLRKFKNIKQEIKKVLKNFNPDIIYFMPATSKIGLLRDYLLVKEIKKRWTKKVFFHIRTRITNENWKNPFIKKIYNKMFKNQKAIVLDNSLKKDLHSLIGEKELFVLPNAIKNELSEKEFNEIIKKRKKKKNFEIIFISNMDKTKGWPKLLRACKILDKKNMDFRCSFIGAWQCKKDEKDFCNFIDNYNLKNKIKYLGEKIGKEKNKILEDSDVLVFPTEYKLETFGRVILEAMMFGLPVIANGIASIPTIIQNEKTGFVLIKNSPEEIAEKIELLIKSKNNRLEMGKRGREKFLKEYILENYAKKFIRILNK